MARGARLPGDGWTPRDWALQQAVDVLDGLLCPGCRQPRWLSHDKALAKQWKVTAERCHTCDRIAARQDELSGPNTHRPQSIYFGAQLPTS